MTKKLTQILSAAGMLAAALFSQQAQAQGASTDLCPVPTFAESINDAVSPVTNFIANDIVFFEIPVVGGADVAEGSLQFTDQPTDGVTFTAAAGDRSVTYEFDSDGAYCADYAAIRIGENVEESATTLYEVLSAAFADTPLQISQDGTLLNFSIEGGASASISASGEGLLASDLDNGAVGLPFVVIWLFTGATFFTLFMRFVNLRGFLQAIRIAKGTYDNPNDPGEVTHFQALTAAVSGTVGLGNIAGVAVAIAVGGPGATFWMILVGLLGMTSKFVECTLGLHYRQFDENGVVTGGPMRYLQVGLAEYGRPKLGRFLSVLFCILCIGGAFGAGNMFQVNQSSQQVINVLVPLTGGEDSFLNGRPWMIGALYSVFVGLVIIGGIRSITRVTEFLVPIMATIYLTAAIVVLGGHLADIPAAFGAILSGAFSPEGITGGFIGVLVQGMRRAAFSNEAGVGSASIAHAAAKTKEPIAEGMVALLEPFIDTVVICTVTALVIIVTGMHMDAGGRDGIALTSAAFATVIDWFPYILSVAVVLFAFSTSITWFYYGHRSFLYLVGNKPKADLTFKVVYLLVLIIGSSMTLTAVMDFADAMILAMAFPNMIGLYILAPKVKGMLDSYLTRLKSGEIKQYVAEPAE
ncbi:MAG: alanine/glycine:cation symporter family protein [Sphingomonadales bacterium]|jgi:AGCS family alanine or glycine:cation symporter